MRFASSRDPGVVQQFGPIAHPVIVLVRRVTEEQKRNLLPRKPREVAARADQIHSGDQHVGPRMSIDDLREFPRVL